MTVRCSAVGRGGSGQAKEEPETAMPSLAWVPRRAEQMPISIVTGDSSSGHPSLVQAS